MPGAATATGTGIAAGLVVFWSSGFIGAELGTREAPADTLLMWRFIVATALLGGAWLLYRAISARLGRRGRLTRRAPLTRRALAEQATLSLFTLFPSRDA